MWTHRYICVLFIIKKRLSSLCLLYLSEIYEPFSRSEYYVVITIARNKWIERNKFLVHVIQYGKTWTESLLFLVNCWKAGICVHVFDIVQSSPFDWRKTENGKIHGQMDTKNIPLEISTIHSKQKKNDMKSSSLICYWYRAGLTIIGWCD